METMFRERIVMQTGLKLFKQVMAKMATGLEVLEIVMTKITDDKVYSIYMYYMIQTMQ